MGCLWRELHVLLWFDICFFRLIIIRLNWHCFWMSFLLLLQFLFLVFLLWFDLIYWLPSTKYIKERTCLLLSLWLNFISGALVDTKLNIFVTNSNLLKLFVTIIFRPKFIRLGNRFEWELLWRSLLLDTI